jgi:predicted dehydrogenase
VFALPDNKADGSVTAALAFASGAAGSMQVSCASFLGSGHRIELYGADGTLILSNPTLDYFRGFELRIARRGEDALKSVQIEQADEDAFSDSRVGPVSRLVQRFVDACGNGSVPFPGVVEGYRVQCLLDAARRAHVSGRWIDLEPLLGEGAPVGAPKRTS